MHPDLEPEADTVVRRTSATAAITNWSRECCLALKCAIKRDLDRLMKLCRDTVDCFQNERTQRDIRSTENKLVRNFSKLIFVRQRFHNEWNETNSLRDFPLIARWFDAIGLDDRCKEILSGQYEDVDELLNADEEELKILLMRGFNLKLDFGQNSIDGDDDEDDVGYDDGNNNDENGGRRSSKDIQQTLRDYVRGYIKHVLRAQRSLHRCLNALKTDDAELSPYYELYWDSWDHWIGSVGEDSRRQSLVTAIEAASKQAKKHSPKPLPPLPDLKTNFLKNYQRTNGDSRSTGSSPLSPPVPPLSAGNFSHRSTSSSSSSSIHVHGGCGGGANIIDPNHVPAVTASGRRPTPPPTPPVAHHKKSFILSSASLFSSNSARNSNNNSSTSTVATTNQPSHDRKFPTTPPPIRRHQTNIFGSENFPLTKSKSHEEHLSNRIEPLDPVINSKLLKKYNLVPLTEKTGPNKNNKLQHNSLDNLPHVPGVGGASHPGIGLGGGGNAPQHYHHPTHQRRRLATEPGSIGSTSPILTSSNCSSPIAISPENQTYSDSRQSSSGDNCFLDSTVPRSPRSQAMSHSIHHRFVSTMKINSIQCNVCEKQMFFGFKCRDCKYYCHRDCQDKAPNSCGLPNELVDLFKQTLSEGQSTTRSSSPKNLPQRAKSQMNYYSSQMSSHSSSNPSSPAGLFSSSAGGVGVVGGGSNTNNHSSSSSATISPTGSNHFKSGSSQFQFPPDIAITSTMSIDYEDVDQNYIAQSPVTSHQQQQQNSEEPASPAAPLPPSPMAEEQEQLRLPPPENTISTIQEEEEQFAMPPPLVVSPAHKPLVDSDKSSNSALITSGSSGDSVRTVTGRLDSQDSQASDLDPNEPSGSGGGSGSSRQWPRRQNSVTSREWDIPYDELKIEDEIGTGRFGTVFRGKWHGAVAIKRLHMMGNNDDDEDRKVLDTFKQEVAIFRKTRHDNLVLFMGACMKPPHLAIVTSLCKGLTLHTHIHVRHDKFNLNRTIMIAEQVCLGMGYLHARGIIHKDLKTKNIFYENGKVIITDFGLSSVAKLCVTNRRGDWLTVPKGWLCYLAPEIIRTLAVNSQESSDDLPFSFSTDIYAFGTVWYELLFGSWPFSGQPPEVIIWQVGKGVKQPIVNFQASKEIKDLLYHCWAYRPEVRPDFGKLYEYLEKLPKKRLQRSPSHPAHLQHASEQTFF